MTDAPLSIAPKLVSIRVKRVGTDHWDQVYGTTPEPKPPAPVNEFDRDEYFD